MLFNQGIYYAWQDKTRLFLAMENQPSGSLYHFCQENISTKGPQSPETCQFYATEIAQALTFLNSNGIIHRDVCLENVVVDSIGKSKLIDFNMSFPMADKRNATTFIGKMNYMAPELVMGLNYNTQVDWWALGILIYAMYRNVLLFNIHPNNKDEIDLESEITKKVLDFNDIKKPVRNVIEKLLKRNPLERLAWKEHNVYPLLDEFFVQGQKILNSSKYGPFIATKLKTVDENETKPVRLRPLKNSLTSIEQAQFHGYYFDSL